MRNVAQVVVVMGVCAALVQGCASGDSPASEEPVDASTNETAADVSLAETAPDQGTVDTSVADTSASQDVDTADGTADGSADAASDTNSGATDTAASGEAGCVSGTFCADGSVCVAGACVACTTDGECSAINALRRCYDGVCKLGNCKPNETPSACTQPGATCCATETTGGTCFVRTGETSCCDDAPCLGQAKQTKCDLTLHACGCPAPAPGEFHVSSTGVDSNRLHGNGSAACPYKSITEALFALSSTPPTVSTTLILDAAATGPTIYGTSCTGGIPCDATPLTIPATITAGLVIKGGGATPADVVVTGDGTSLFDVRAPGVGFQNLTLKPIREAANGAGGTAIIYNAPAGSVAVPEGAVTNVVIQGKYATSALAGTGTGILLNNAASPTLGPGLTIDGGFLGVNVTGPARPVIVGSTAAPTLITTLGDNCIRAVSTSAIVPGFHVKSLDLTKTVTIQDCGTRAVSLDTAATPTTPSRIEGATIRKTSAGGAFDAIVVRTAAQLELSGVDIVNVSGRGLLLDAGAVASRPKMDIKTVLITAPGGVGALFQGYGDAVVDGLTVSSSASIGVQVAGFAALTGKTFNVQDSAGIGVSIGATSTATIDGLIIRRGASTGLDISGTAVATIKSSDIRDTIGGGVVVQDAAQGIFTTLLMRGAGAIGFRVMETADVTLTGGDVRTSTLDGLRCDGTVGAKLKLRSSAFLSNLGNGVLISGACLADLGTSGEVGGNIFNRTATLNSTSGLCVTTTATRPTPSGSTFGCGNATATCTTPATIPAGSVTLANACAALRDITSSTTALTVYTPRCCN